MSYLIKLWVNKQVLVGATIQEIWVINNWNFYLISISKNHQKPGQDMIKILKTNKNLKQKMICLKQIFFL